MYHLVQYFFIIQYFFGGKLARDNSQGINKKNNSDKQTLRIKSQCVMSLTIRCSNIFPHLRNTFSNCKGTDLSLSKDWTECSFNHFPLIIQPFHLASFSCHVFQWTLSMFEMFRFNFPILMFRQCFLGLTMALCPRALSQCLATSSIDSSLFAKIVFSGGVWFISYIYMRMLQLRIRGNPQRLIRSQS